MGVLVEKLLAAFRIADLQRFVTISLILERSGKTSKDVEEYVFHKLRRRDEVGRGVPRKVVVSVAPKCEKCGSALIPFNVEKNDRDIKSRWACSKNWHDKDMNEWCDYELLSTKTIREILNEGVQYEIRRGFEEGTKVEQEQPSQ